CAVTVATSTPGCADSRRSVSPPAYPDAPTTAARTRCGVSAVAGIEAGMLLAEDMPEVYTAECMNSQRWGGRATEWMTTRSAPKASRSLWASITRGRGLVKPLGPQGPPRRRSRSHHDVVALTRHPL